jgi:hypothetical protein
MHLIVMGFLQRSLVEVATPKLRRIDIDQRGDGNAPFLGFGRAARTCAAERRHPPSEIAFKSAA